MLKKSKYHLSVIYFILIVPYFIQMGVVVYCICLECRILLTLLHTFCTLLRFVCDIHVEECDNRY